MNAPAVKPEDDTRGDGGKGRGRQGNAQRAGPGDFQVQFATTRDSTVIIGGRRNIVKEVQSIECVQAPGDSLLLIAEVAFNAAFNGMLNVRVAAIDVWKKLGARADRGGGDDTGDDERTEAARGLGPM